MAYIPIQLPPKDTPPDDLVRDNYRVLVPLQEVSHTDYDPQVNGEITRRVPWPRHLFRKPYEMLLRGLQKPCNKSTKVKSYRGRAYLKMGHTEAYSITSNHLYGDRVDPYSDPRATVELKDKTGKLYGAVYPEPCGYACIAVVVRIPYIPSLYSLVGYAFPRDNFP